MSTRRMPLASNRASACPSNCELVARRVSRPSAIASSTPGVAIAAGGVGQPREPTAPPATPLGPGPTRTAPAVARPGHWPRPAPAPESPAGRNSAAPRRASAWSGRWFGRLAAGGRATPTTRCGWRYPGPRSARPTAIAAGRAAGHSRCGRGVGSRRRAWPPPSGRRQSVRAAAEPSASAASDNPRPGRRVVRRSASCPRRLARCRWPVAAGHSRSARRSAAARCGASVR
jgi:hypothetical protein